MIYFKTATAENAKAIAELVNSAYRGPSSKVGWTTEAELLDGQRTDPESILALINEENNFIELGFQTVTNQLLASVHIKIESDKFLYFGMLTVAPNFQAQGLGKIILNHIETIAKKNHCSTIRLSVIDKRVELIDFYKRRGFVATGNFEPFPENDPKFGIPKITGMKLLEFIKVIS